MACACLGAYSSGSACATWTKADTRTALDARQMACVLANSFLDSDALRKACMIADDLTPAIRDLIAAQREAEHIVAARRAAAAHDGGVP